MPLPYDSRHVANNIIDAANEKGSEVSITRLLKLAYMAHGWTLALLEKPLVNDYVQAWKYGSCHSSDIFFIQTAWSLQSSKSRTALRT